MSVELQFLSAGREITGRSGDESFIRIVVTTPSGATRRVRLTEEQALRVVSDLLAAVIAERKS